MTQSDMTPFDMFRAIFKIGVDETEVELVSPDRLIKVKVTLRRVNDPFEEVMTLQVLEPMPRRIPRMENPKVYQTGVNGKVWVHVAVPNMPRLIEASDLDGLAFRIGIVTSLTGFSTAMLTLLRQGGGDSEFAGYFQRA